jgi:predicted lipoprotein with Yx(FWY)xxD motif
MTRSISYSAGVALAVGALLLAGCGGDGDSGGGGGGERAASAGIVSVADVDGTDVLADSQGRTLYSAPVEKAKVLCLAGCTSFWQPVMASAADARRAASDLGADLGVLKRPDGGRQLTFDGLPLYTFTEEGAGQLTGDGFVDDFQGTHFEWQAARTDGGSSSPAQGGGYGY